MALAVDHFGKMAETGTRGGSAKEASADAVLALLAERELAGNVSNSRMAIRKVRGAPTGNEVPFVSRSVDLGPDENGNPQTTLVIDWKIEGASQKPTKERWPPSLVVLRDALVDVVGREGKDQRPFADSPVVKAADRESVREEFHRRYPAEGDTEERRQEARKKAFTRSLTNAHARKMIGVTVIDGKTVMWLASAGT